MAVCPISKTDAIIVGGSLKNKSLSDALWLDSSKNSVSVLLPDFGSKMKSAGQTALLSDRTVLMLMIDSKD